MVAILIITGSINSELIWSAAWVILNRIFVYHFLIGILIGLIIIVHIVLLHNFSSSNPFINNNTLIISFYPFIFKDLFSFFVLIAGSISIFLYWEPDILGNSDNQIVANPLVTPNNILPEWYYLLFYSCLRSFPNKTIGVLLVLNILIMIIYSSSSLFLFIWPYLFTFSKFLILIIQYCHIFFSLFNTLIFLHPNITTIHALI